MTYSRATELLGFTTPKSPAANAQLAKSALASMNSSTPLKFKVAARTIIDAAK